MKSVFFGSIGAVAETSEFQRQAYNQALDETGLGWYWGAETYRQLLNYVGGKERLRLLADATSVDLNDDTINKIHARKTELACAAIVSARVPLRPGVSELARQVKLAGGKIGFVTTTYKPNIDAIFDLGHAGFTREDVDVIIGRNDVERGKPAPDAYEAALSKAALNPGDVIAIEDTVSSAKSAKRAGLKVILTPGAFSMATEEAEVDLTIPALANRQGGLNRQVLDMIGPD